MLRSAHTTLEAPHADAHPAGTRTVSLLVGTAVFVLTQLYAAIPLLGPVGDDLGGDVTFALATCFSLCYAIGFLIWGPVADHYGRKKAMTAGLLVLSVATLACGFAPSTTWLAVLRCVQGLAAASFAPSALAYLSEAVPPHRRAGAIGAISTAFLVAGIFGQVFASWISLNAGWPWMFAVSAAVLAGAFLAAALTVAEAPRPASPGHLGHRFLAAGRLITRPTMLLLCAAHVTMLMSFVGMYTALGPHLGALGLEESDVIWLRLAGLPGMFAALLAGRLIARWGTENTARAGYSLAAAGIAGEALLGQSLAGVTVASLVFVTGVAVAVPAMITLFGREAAPDRGSGMALTGFILFVGASLGPVVARQTGDFTALLLAFAGCLVFSAGCVTVFKRLVAGTTST
ncbi:MAG TPA: MFS transporter [Spirillospora sp.]